MENEDGVEVVFSYSDRQAVEDGVLVNISGLKIPFQGLWVNRMTGGLWADVAEPLISEGPDELKVIVLQGFLNAKVAKAQDSIHNTGEAGDIYTIPASNDCGKLWLVRNEVGGFTILRPSEY